MKRKHILFLVLAIVVVVVIAVIFPFDNTKTEASLYTPFGGEVEEYIEKSNADCVVDTCGELNNEVQGIINETLTGVYSFLTPIVPWGTLAAVALRVLVEGFSICNVEEIKIVRAKEASVGILNIIDFRYTILGFTVFSLNIGDYLNLSVLTPKIYDYEDYKTEGNMVVGDSLDILDLCGLAGEGTSAICDNEIMEALIGSIADGQEAAGDEAYTDAIADGASEEDAQTSSDDAEEDYATSCPLLNLLHQIGTCRSYFGISCTDF